MALRDDVLPVIVDGWALVQDLGITRYTCTIRTRTWSGGKVQLGVATVSDLTLDPNPWVEERDSGNELLITDITPSHSGGGYTPAQLNPSTSAAVESYWIVTGPAGSHSYELFDIDASDAFAYRVTLKTLQRSKPF